MSVLETFTHDPQAKLDYNIDWSAWLVGSDTISASTWDSSPTGLTLSLKSVNAGGTIAACFVSGGTAGSKYTVRNHIVTTAGREDDRTIAIRISDR